MNSTLKVVLPIGLLILVVFFVTLINQTVGDAGKPNEEKPAISGPPLLFPLTEMYYKPDADDVARRSFPGFYEIKEAQNPVSFWFQNPYPVPVKVTVLARSCTACSSVRLAVVPPEALRALPARAAVAGGTADPAPDGQPSPPDLLAPLGEALVDPASFKDFNFERPEEPIEVPPATADGPTWGVLRFGIRVGAVGQKDLWVDIGLAAPGQPQVALKFKVTMVGVNPFEVIPRGLPLGVLPEGAPPVNRELYYWSATRGPGELAPPKIVAADDPFVKVGSATLLTPAECEQQAAQFSAENQGAPIRVLAGYKIPVTVYRRRPDPSPGAPAEPDIGPFERSIVISCPGTPHTVRVPITATVTGLVSLTRGEAVDLGSFKGKYGRDDVAARLVSDRTDLELELLPAESKPAYLRVSLSPPQAESGRRFWTLKVGVPPEACLDELPADSVVVFRAKTVAGVQKVRIPVKGRGYSSG